MVIIVYSQKKTQTDKSRGDTCEGGSFNFINLTSRKHILGQPFVLFT